ncbi:MAG TPA: Mth938-like domain-containing protein [Dongiaceae bacterium]|nr:Mth938-like domain-containing protein [Dongiaceae bacterium]
MDLTPLIPSGRQIVESYGEGRFRVTGQQFQGAILVFPQRTLAWPVGAAGEASLENLEPVLAAGREGVIELLLFGQGPRMLLVPPELRQGVKAVGIVLEPMDTGAACRTYNVLMAEGRRVAAALIPVP